MDMGDIHTEFHFDDANSRLLVNRVQDCEPVMEQAKKIARELTPSKDVRHVARIPKVIVEQYCNRNNITLREWLIDPSHADRMLKDPDLAYFRTNPA